MKNNILLITLVLSVLTGCSNMRDATVAHQYTDDAKESVNTHIDEIKSYITRNEKVSIKMAEMPDPNDFLNNPVSLVVNELNFTNLSQILPSVINREVRFANDLENPVVVENQRNSSDGNFITKPLSLNYKGALSGLLNSICYQLKCSWQVRDDNSIYISKFQTRFWRLAILPSDRTSSTSLSSENKYGGDSSGGGGGGEAISGGTTGSSSVKGDSGQTVTSTFQYKALETVKSIIEPILGVSADQEGSGQSWSYSAQTGILSVTANNQTLENVDILVANLSDFLTAQVLFNIKIITYDEQETEGYGIDWNLVWERMGELGVNTNIGTAVDAGSDQIGISVLESGQPFSGTTAFINALSEFATISSTKEFNYSTLSNQVLPFHIAEEIPFNVVEQTITEFAVAQSFTIFNKSVGLHMNLLPVILSPERLMMEFKFSLSNLTGFLDIDLGDNGSARIPQTKVNEAMQQVMLNSGEAVVLSGFTIDDATISKRSPVKSKMWWLGGSKNEERKKSSMVIVVTPQIKY